MKTRLPLWPGLGLLMTAACAVADPDPAWHTVSPQPFDALRPEFVGSPPSWLGSVEPRSVTGGDQLSYGLIVRDGGSVEPRHWVVDLAARAIESEESGPCVACDVVSVACESGDVAHRASKVRCSDLHRDLWGACIGTADRENADRALLCLLQALRTSPAFEAVVRLVIDRPSLLSVITHFGVRVRRRCLFEEARPGDPVRIAGQEMPTFELPFEVDINGRSALRVIVVLVRPVDALRLGSGVVALYGWRPSDPSVGFSLGLLSARAAGGPAVARRPDPR